MEVMFEAMKHKSSFLYFLATVETKGKGVERQVYLEEFTHIGIRTSKRGEHELAKSSSRGRRIKRKIEEKQ